MHKISESREQKQHPILVERDLTGIRQLYGRFNYLDTLSVVLSEALQKNRSSHVYDGKLIAHLLANGDFSSYSHEELDALLLDVKEFENLWVTVNDKRAYLCDVFERCMGGKAYMKHFDHLKDHRFAARIHRPVLAVLSLRAKEWKQKLPSAVDTEENLLDILY